MKPRVSSITAPSHAPSCSSPKTTGEVAARAPDFEPTLGDISLDRRAIRQCEFHLALRFQS